MARIVDTLYDTTSATAGTLTATLNTANYNRLLVISQCAGANGAGATSTYKISDYSTGTAITLVTLLALTGSNAARADGVGPGTTATPASGTASQWPVPIVTQITNTAGASTTVRLIVYGVIEASV